MPVKILKKANRRSLGLEVSNHCVCSKSYDSVALDWKWNFWRSREMIDTWSGLQARPLASLTIEFWKRGKFIQAGCVNSSATALSFQNSISYSPHQTTTFRATTIYCMTQPRQETGRLKNLNNLTHSCASSGGTSRSGSSAI